MNVLTVLERLSAAAATAIGTPALVMTAYDHVPDKVTAPCCYPSISGSIEFDLTMNRGLDKMTVTLTVLAPAGDDREGQRLLWSYMDGAGPSSVKAAIEAERGAPGVGALGGACDDLHVKRVSEPRRYEVGGQVYPGAEWTVEIFGGGS